MLEIRPKDIPTTAAEPAADDYLVLDGASEGTRKRAAFGAIFDVMASAVPLSGSWRRGALVRNSLMNNIGDPTGWVCFRPGTYGTLSGVTATGSLAADSVTVNEAGGMVVGEFVRFGVVDETVYEITSVAGTAVGISPNLVAAISGAAVWHPYPWFSVAGIVGGGWLIETMDVTPPQATVAESPLAAGTVAFSAFAMRPAGTLTSQQVTGAAAISDVGTGASAGTLTSQQVTGAAAISDVGTGASAGTLTSQQVTEGWQAGDVA